MHLSFEKRLSHLMVCADAGGPLLVKEKGIEFLYGIYSYPGRALISALMPKDKKLFKDVTDQIKNDIIYCGGPYTWSHLDHPISMFTDITSKVIAAWIHGKTVSSANTTHEAHGDLSACRNCILVTH